MIKLLWHKCDWYELERNLKFFFKPQKKKKKKKILFKKKKKKKKKKGVEFKIEFQNSLLKSKKQLTPKKY